MFNLLRTDISNAMKTYTLFQQTFSFHFCQYEEHIPRALHRPAEFSQSYGEILNQ